MLAVRVSVILYKVLIKITKYIHYNARTHPKISYCSVAWSFALNEAQRNKLNVLQNLVLKTALCTASSTPKHANKILTNNLPPDLYIQQTCLSIASSLIAEKHWAL